MEETLSKFLSESAKRHKENSNTIKEIQASTDASVRNQGASIKTLEIQIGQISKVLQERGFGSLPSSTKSNPRDHVKSILTNIETDSNPICRIGLPQYGVSTSQNTYSYGASHIDNSIPRKEKYPGSFTLPCYINNVCFDNVLADLGASSPKIDVFKRKITLRVGDDKIIFKCIKPASSLIKRVYMLCLRERVELDLKARLMGETLVLNRSLDPLYGDYIELNDLNVPLELRRDQVDDLIPTFEEGKIHDSKGSIPSRTAADEKVAIQEMAEYSQKWHNGIFRTRSTKTSNGLAAIQAQLNNLGREIKKVNEKVYAAQVRCEQCKGVTPSNLSMQRNVEYPRRYIIGSIAQ
ncbi:hypothetical protein Tco_0731448, partial [Tanacetum coccineum]